LTGDLPPQLLAGVLYFGSGIGLTIVALVRSRTPGVYAALHSSDTPFLTGAVVFGGISAPVFLVFGLVPKPASRASLLLNLETVFTATIAWGVFHENIDRRIAAGLMTIVAGGVVLSWNGSFVITDYGGPLAIAGACLCFQDCAPTPSLGMAT